jgi:hypothetical protein
MLRHKQIAHTRDRRLHRFVARSTKNWVGEDFPVLGLDRLVPDFLLMIDELLAVRLHLLGVHIQQLLAGFLQIAGLRRTQ